MTEAFLHHIWKFQLFKTRKLFTTKEEELQLLNPGYHNKDSGPDFFNAKVNISETLWAGNVEIHINASDWNKHGHESDAAYNNTILHVVYNADCDVVANGRTLQTLELKNLISDSILEKFMHLHTVEDWIPCRTYIPLVDDFSKKAWLDRLLVERIEKKCGEIEALHLNNKENWEETLFQLLAKNFGFSVNALPFEMLARSVSTILLGRLNTPQQIEAVLFGQAGFLEEEIEDDYYKSLKEEYLHQQVKNGLSSLDVSVWKFSKLRPLNFPTLRIAQFSALIAKAPHFFSALIQIKTLKELSLFFEIRLHPFWDSHYSFQTCSSDIKKSLGKSSVQNIIINTIVPLFFFYGKKKGLTAFQEFAMSIMEALPPEKNNITAGWKDLGMKGENAGSAQSLIQLKKEYCDKKKCLDCGIGNKILRDKREVEIA